MQTSHICCLVFTLMNITPLRCSLWWMIVLWDVQFCCCVPAEHSPPHTIMQHFCHPFCPALLYTISWLETFTILRSYYTVLACEGLCRSKTQGRQRRICFQVHRVCAHAQNLKVYASKYNWQYSFVLQYSKLLWHCFPNWNVYIVCPLPDLVVVLRVRNLS